MDDIFTHALTDRFDPDLDQQPYQSDQLYHQDLMSLVSLYLTNCVAFKTASGLGEIAGELNLAGSAFTPEQAVSYVGSYGNNFCESDSTVMELIAYCEIHIEGRLKATLESGQIPLIERLRVIFHLSDFEFFCLICAYSSCMDRGFERLFMTLHGDEQLHSPTLGGIIDMYSLIHGKDSANYSVWSGMLEQDKSFVFVNMQGDLPLLQPIKLSKGVLFYLVRKPYLSPELESVCEFIKAKQCATPLFLEEQINAVAFMANQIRQQKSSRFCVLCGDFGCGKKLTLRAVSAAGGGSFLLVRLDEIIDWNTYANEIVSVALMWDLIPCFVIEDAACDQRLDRLMRTLVDKNISGMILTKKLRRNIVIENCIVQRVDYPLLKIDQSLHMWTAFSGEYNIDHTVDFEQIAAKYQITAGRIKSALAVAHEIAQRQDKAIDTAQLDAAILLGNTGRLSEIADKIEVFYSWEDLVLGGSSKEMLRDVCNRIKYRHQVETKWGFSGKSAYGNGISILLYGPPGTGKTMSAQVIAGELGLPIYRINLSQIISKYIGETAKNLDSVFSEAKSSNVILFFDEADSLFAKRTDVKTSNDRHANSESSYLLQKIEEYSGISILATNLANNFDEAFRRRIGYMINIHMPSAAERLTLWQGAFPANAPLAKDMDLQVLADNLEFSGSVIKSAVLQAAYFAACDDTQITMTHIAKAAGRELQKLGRTQPHFLSIYLG